MSRIKRPFVLIGFSMLVVAAAALITGAWILNVFFIISILCCIFLCLFRSAYGMHLLVISLVICLVSISLAIHDGNYRYACLFQTEDAVISGKVLTFPSDNAGRMSGFTLDECKINNRAVPCKIMVYSDKMPELTPGDEICVSVESVIENNSEGIFRYHSLSTGIYLTAFSYSDVGILKMHNDKNPYTAIMKIRRYFEDRIFSVLDSDSGAITNALITGDKEYLSAEMMNALKVSGVSHIFAVSGMHLSLWTGIFFIIFKRRAKVKKLPNILAILFVLFYIVFTGFSPSVLRSGIMLLCVFIGAVIRRHSDALNALGLSVAVLVFLNPCLAGNISFLLSFTATFTLITISDKVSISSANKKDEKAFVRRKFVNAVNSVLVSFSVIFMTLPLTSLFFGYVSFISPFVSLVVTPIAQILMMTGAAGVIFPTESFIASVLFYVTEFLSKLMVNVLSFTGKMTFAVVPAELHFVLPFFIFSVLLFLFIRFILKKDKTAVYAVLLLFVAVLSISVVREIMKSDEINIYIPADSDGSFVCVYTNDGHSMIYGGSDKYDECARIVSALNKNGILRADYLFNDSVSGDRYIGPSLAPKNTVQLYKRGETVYCDEILWNNTRISSVVSDDINCAALFTDGIKTVICRKKVNEEPLKEIFSDGDIMICFSDSVAGVDMNKYDKVIFIGKNETMDFTSDITIPTSNELKITVKGDNYAIY